MIGKLSGLVDSAGADWAIVDVSGVGYVVHCSGRGFAALPGQGEPVSLWIETHVREDHIHLYGFPEAAERDWFRLLSTVQGVGARVALAILSVLAPDDLIQAIAAQDQRAVARANGVGPKLAGRIVTELKDKAGQFALGPAAALDESFRRAAGNIPGVDVLPEQGANVYDILRRDTLVLTKDAVEALEARLK